MKLTILGSGTMMPTAKRSPSSYLLDAGSTRLLLDAGHMTIAQLLKHNVPLREIEMVAVTHFHTDHFSNVLPFVHSMWVDNLSTKRQAVPLTIMGPKTLQERFRKLREVYWPEPTEKYPMTWVEGETSHTMGSLSITSFPMTHVEWFPSVGYKIEEQGKTLLYTGDVGGSHPKEDLIEKAKGVDLLLIEAAALQPAPNHYTVDDVLKIVREAAPKQTILTHIREQNLPTLRAKVSGHKNVVIAEDGMSVTI